MRFAQIINIFTLIFLTVVLFVAAASMMSVGWALVAGLFLSVVLGCNLFIAIGCLFSDPFAHIREFNENSK